MEELPGGRGPCSVALCVRIDPAAFHVLTATLTNSSCSCPIDGVGTRRIQSNEGTQNPRPSQGAERGSVSPGGEVRPAQGSRDLIRRKYEAMADARAGLAVGTNAEPSW
jgi:hypothetical protein